MSNKTVSLIRVSEFTKEFRKIKLLYQTAFPLPERLPFPLLWKRSRTGFADFWGIYDKQRWVGFAYVIRGEGLAYLYFFAIRPELRNEGYGSAALRLIREIYQNDVLFLALEQLDPAAENYPERLHRHDFYLRCGLHDLPMKIREMTMVYASMGSGAAVAPADFDAMMRRFLGRCFYPLIRTYLLPQTDEKKGNNEIRS